jgi:hypothetical protein
MPVSILLTAVATVYFSMNYEFTKAIKLGTLAGAMTGISFSLILALIITIVRFVRMYHIRAKLKSNESPIRNSPVQIDPTIYTKKYQKMQDTSEIDVPQESDSIEEKIMLLMDKELAYEVSLNSINHKNIGDIIHQNKSEGSILLRSRNEEIKILITSLTKHTSQVLITSTIDNSNMKNIISTLKEKEHSFMQY